MVTIQETLQRAAEHQRTGQLDQAEQLYLHILAADPQHIDALHMLGLIALRMGKIDLADDYISRVVRLKPDFAEAHNNLGTVLQSQGKLAEAIGHWQQAVRLKPQMPEAYNNLGLALAEQGRLGEAIASFQQALVMRPNYREARSNLDHVLKQQGTLIRQGQLREAAARDPQAGHFQPEQISMGAGVAIRVEPNAADGASQLLARIAQDIAETCNKNGNALFAQGKLDEAAARYCEALRHKPDCAEAYSNLGAVLYRQGKLEDAVAAERQALRYKPHFVAAHCNLGTALYSQGKLAEAMACYQRAIGFDPNYAPAHFNLGIALDDQGLLEEAIASYQAALRLQPDYADAHKNLGMAWLLGGHFEQGWPEYEWRWKTDIATPNFRQPPWDGSPLEGRTILLHTEQGAGDTLQFVRYAALVRQRGGKPLLYCPRPLIRLLAGCSGIEGLIAQGDPLPDFDVHASLMSLPGILGTTLATIPGHVPYLFGDSGLIEHWRRELGEQRGFKIGIAWQGSSLYRRDAQRSIPLEHFAPVARLEGVKLFSLQKGAGSEQLGAVAGRMAVTDLGRRLDETSGAFLDTAAVMKNLDLVITSDTVIAHLAGALGVPVWVGLCYQPDWRWLLQRDDCPWYPTMRLFRQPEPGNWPAVFERMASELPQACRLTDFAPPRGPAVTDPLLARVGQEVAESLTRKGNSLFVQGQLDEAIAAYRQALSYKTDLPAAHNGLGAALFRQGKYQEAIDSCRQALRYKPADAKALSNLAAAYYRQQEPEKAAACCRQALQIDPNDAVALNNLGMALHDLGKLEDAVVNYRQALRVNPDDANVHFNLGITLARQDEAQQAAACYEQAIRLQPDNAEAYNNLAVAWLALGKPDQALACHREALRIMPDHQGAHDNLLLSLQYQPGITLAELAAAHGQFERQHAASWRAAWRPHENVREPERKLRVGFVSADLGLHPVGYFLIGPMESLDRSQIEIVCYSDRRGADPMTRRFQAVAAIWRDVVGVGDEQLAEQIRADQIDILVDLAGHTSGNRLSVFARKPAPIQITWAGYVGTTGLAAIDYLIADSCYVPQESERYYREKILRLPDAYVAYAPPTDAPAVKPLPALTSGRVTFGSFNNPVKLTREVVKVWAGILKRVPRSRLVLKNRGMSNALSVGRFTEWFAGEGIEPDRLELLDFSPHAELLEHYNSMDIALDPFPYSGGLTTCEALWMGVPVITCPGETFASRHSFSYLSVIGLTETICRSFMEYENRAVALAGDLPRLAELRRGLRQQVAGSPLCDSQRFARNLLAALRDAWRQYCAGG